MRYSSPQYHNVKNSLKRERENQQDVTIRCLLSTSVSTCFGHQYVHLQENKDRVTAYAVLRWFCWMWLVAVVGRCVVGCEHCEVFTSYKTAPHNRYQSQPAEPAQYSICSNTVFVLLKMGIMMPETCWDRSWLQTSNCCILLVFSISSHFAHDARSQEPKSNWIIVSGEITVSFLESQKCRYIKFEIRLMLWQVL